MIVDKKNLDYWAAKKLILVRANHLGQGLPSFLDPVELKDIEDLVMVAEKEYEKGLLGYMDLIFI